MKTQSRVLVIEEDAALRTSLCTAFEGAGYRALPSDHAVAPLNVQQLRPDLVVLDPMLGDQPDGYAWLEAVRAWPWTASLPVLVCSEWAPATAPEHERVQALSDAIVRTPVDLTALLAAAEHCLTRELRVHDAAGARACRDKESIMPVERSSHRPVQPSCAPARPDEVDVLTLIARAERACGPLFDHFGPLPGEHATGPALPGNRDRQPAGAELDLTRFDGHLKVGGRESSNGRFINEQDESGVPGRVPHRGG